MNCNPKRKTRGLKTPALALLLMALIIFALSGCLLKRREKSATPAAPPATQAPDASDARDLRATKKGEAATAPGGGAATETAKPPEVLAEDKRMALMKESGFDMINPNFSKNIGRKDPFQPVSLSMAPFEWLKKMAPDSYRLVATVKGFLGTFALIEMGKEDVIVKAGDVIKGNMKVLAIHETDVVFEQNGEQKVLGMKVRVRNPQEAPAQKIGKLPNLNDMWKEYLEKKYGGDVEAAAAGVTPGAKGTQQDFSAFVTGKEKGIFEQ